MDLDTTSRLLWLLSIAVVASVSFSFYSQDGNESTRQDETVRVPSVPNAKIVISICFYGTVLVAALSGFLQHPLLLVGWDDPTARLCGAGLSVIGITIFALAKLRLAEHYSPCFGSVVPEAIVSTGIYRYVRHPIYLGNLVVLAGAFFATGSVWIGCFFAALATLYRRTIRIEEASLLEHLPGYEAYRERSGALLPKLVFAPGLRGVSGWRRRV